MVVSAVDSEGDRLLYLFLAEVSDAAQGLLPPDQRALLLAELRRRIEHDRQELNASGEHAMRQLLARYPDAYTVVRDEAYLHPIEETLPDLEPATVAFAAAPAGGGGGAAGGGGGGGGGGGAPAAVPPQVRRGGPQIPLDDDIRPSGAIVPGVGDLPPVEPDEAVDEGIVPGDAARPPAAAGDRALQFARSNRLEVGTLVVFAISALLSQLLLLLAGYILLYFSKHPAWSGKVKRFTAVAIPLFCLVLFVIDVWLYGSGRWGGVQLGGSSLGHEIATLFHSLVRGIALLALVYLGWRLFRKRSGGAS